MEFTDLFDVKDFIRNLIDLIRKCVERELYVAVLMVRGISLGKGFQVINTRRAQVRKWLKRSALNFAHTFLKDYCTIPWPRFSNNELFIFYRNNSTSFESVFCMKIVKSRLFKKYLKGRKSRARFCLSLGWLNISEKKLLNTTILSVQELIKQEKQSVFDPFS